MIKSSVAWLILILVAGSVWAETSIDWRRGPDLPSARDHLGCGMVDGMFVIAGGAYWKNDRKHYQRETLAYSSETGKWIRLPFLPTPGAYGASAVVDEQLVIAGGANETGVLKSCIRLARKGGSYRWQKLPDLPCPLFGAKGAVMDNAFYVIGGAPGMDEAGVRAARPSVLRLHDSRWSECSLPDEFAGRVGAAVASVNNKIFILGGYGVRPDGALGNFGDAWSFDGTKWKRIRDVPIAARWTTALTLDRTHIGLFGGYGDGFLDKVFVYDTEGDTYTESTPLPLPVCSLAGGIADGTIYLAGGEDLQRHRSAAFFMGTIR